jgi:glucose-6-phosphate isomerase
MISRHDFFQDLALLAAATPELRVLFDAEDNRAEAFAMRLGEVTVDFSKQRMSDAALDGMLSSAKQLGLAEAIFAMFAGDSINASEKRAVLHGLLRTPESKVPSHLISFAQSMRDAHVQMFDLANALNEGRAEQLGLVNATDVVNIGIGGSDLGPRLVCEAMAFKNESGPRVHFMTNVDAHGSSLLLRRLNPATTLFIVASKSFGTQETKLNAELARGFIRDYLRANQLPESQLEKHFVAVSSNVKAAVEFGMAANRVLPMSDTVGGRYSVWSTVGLAACIAMGSANFRQFLNGAHLADENYQQADLRQNLSVVLAMIEIWNRNGLGFATRAVVPYDDRLARLPEFLQQLEMESNGKGVALDGGKITWETGPVVWGAVGTNVQHAFFQSMHQGTQIVPIDFIGVIKPDHAHLDNHRALLANMLAQSAALARGKSFHEAIAESPPDLSAPLSAALANARTFPGNRPSTTYLLDQLSPEALGTLIAALENKTHAMGVMYGINSFDQWGVELGKSLANAILPALQDASLAADFDASTKSLLGLLR